MTKGKYKLRVDVGIDFSIATIMTYENDCEKIHGHNFQVAFEIEGQLNNDSLLFDFRIIKANLRKICKELDEHFLLPTLNRKIKYHVKNENVNFSILNKEYSIPQNEVILIDLPNITAEGLAFYVYSRITKEIEFGKSISSISVEIQEKPGQSASYVEVYQ